MSLRDVTIARDGKRGYTVRVTLRTGSAWRILGDFEKVSELRTWHRTRRLTLACSWRPLWRVPHVLRGVGRWKSQYRKIVSLSLCRRTLKLKGNKKVSYLNWEVVTCFSNFEILCSMYICVMFWPSTRPNKKKMLFQGDAPEGSDTFQWQLGEEIAWAEIGWWNGTR